jgi:hypothetical protein
MTTKEIFENVQPIFQKFKSQKYTEFEFRLGKINRGTFDTNVGKEVFDRILEGLKMYKGWESVKEKSDVAYYNENIRLLIDDDTEESVQVVKENLFKSNYSLTSRPLDVRFSVAKETPFEKSDIEFTMAKQRKRFSFVRKNLSIDLTIVSGNPADLDSEEQESYQVEFEIIDPSKVNNDDTLYNIIYKVNDVLDLLRTV